VRYGYVGKFKHKPALDRLVDFFARLSKRFYRSAG
jgi:hypothetical protein